MTTKKQLAQEYIRLKKFFDGQDFKPTIKAHNSVWLANEFKVQDLKDKIEAVKSAIKACSIKITYKWFDGRYIEQETTMVIKRANYKGHDIYQDIDQWYFLNDGNNWQYFGTIMEAKRFITHIINN